MHYFFKIFVKLIKIDKIIINQLSVLFDKLSHISIEKRIIIFLNIFKRGRQGNVQYKL